MADSYMVDVNNREQIKEFLVYVSTSPDGVKMGARAVAITGSTLPNAQALPTKIVHTDGQSTTRYITGSAQDAGALVGVSAHLMAYTGNAANFEPWRNNNEAPVHTSTARTTGTPSPDQTLYNGCGVDIIIDVTAIGPAPSVTFTIEVKDPTSGKYVAVLTSPAIIAIGTYRMVVYPGIAAVANKAANDRVRRTWRLTPVHTNVDSITYGTSKCDLV